MGKWPVLDGADWHHQAVNILVQAAPVGEEYVVEIEAHAEIGAWRQVRAVPGEEIGPSRISFLRSPVAGAKSCAG